MIDAKYKDVAQKRLLELLASCGPRWGQCEQLAVKLGVPSGTIRKWKSRGYASMEGALLAEEKIGGKFKAGYLRPDVFSAGTRAGDEHAAQ
jgi:hypothetical protein